MAHTYLKTSESDRGWLEAMGWDRVNAVLRYTSPDVAAINQSSDVVRVEPDPSLGAPPVVFLKRYRYDRPSQRIKQMFRGTLFGKSRARFEFEFLHAMEQRGVPTVRPIAFGEKRKNGFLRACFLITEGAVGVESLDTYALRHLEKGRWPRGQRRNLTTLLASAIRAMHDAGVKHGGLFWRNVLIRDPADPPQTVLFLDPDTHGRLFPGAVPRAAAMEDLSDFVSSALAFEQKAGMLHFMRGYFRQPLRRPAQREMIRRILRMAEGKARAEQHRLAVTETIGRLRNRIARSRADEDVVGTVDSVEAFFDKLASLPRRDATLRHEGQTIHFLLEDRTDGPVVHRTVLLKEGRFRVTHGLTGWATLVIRSDPQTWMSLVAGRSDAFGLIQSGGLRVEGDTRVLALLAERLGL